MTTLPSSERHPTLWVAVGIPGSGKSFFFDRSLIVKPEGERSVVVSTDQIRDELFGDVAEMGYNDAIFAAAKVRCIRYLDAQMDVVFDATNVHPIFRLGFLDEMKEHAAAIYAAVFMTPLDVCLARNEARDRQVPEDVIRRFHRYLTLYPPTTEEGFDRILTISP